MKEEARQKPFSSARTIASQLMEENLGSETYPVLPSIDRVTLNAYYTW